MFRADNSATLEAFWCIVRSLDEIRPGLTLGRYELLLPIARGGMASVWAARVQGARGFEKIFAIKTMLPGLTEDPNAERMFLDEARIASRIRHPNVVEILDLGEQQGLLYLVMEWVDGASLATIMREASRQNGIPLNISVKIILDACAGLHAAHELRDENGHLLQVVHRDVSPQNILVDESGVVKIVDFGVAKALGRMSAETADGQIRGKLYFLAPEQVLQKPVDRRTDLFALGTILYQLTTGQHPFRSDNAGATMNNILRRRVPKPTTLVEQGYPQALEDIVMRTLDREPEFRFQTAADMLKALDTVFVGASRATTEDVHAFIKPLIGEAGREFRAALKQAARDLSGGTAEGSSIAVSGLASPTTESSSPASPASTQQAAAMAPPPISEQTISGSETDAPRPRPKSRRAIAGIIAAAVVLLAVGILALAMRSRHDATPTLAASRAVDVQTTASAAVATVDAVDPPAASGTAEPIPSASDSPAGDDAEENVAPAPTHPAKPANTRPRDKGKPPANKKWTPPVDDPGI